MSVLPNLRRLSASREVPPPHRTRNYVSCICVSLRHLQPSTNEATTLDLRKDFPECDKCGRTGVIRSPMGRNNQPSDQIPLRPTANAAPRPHPLLGGDFES